MKIKNIFINAWNTKVKVKIEETKYVLKLLFVSRRKIIDNNKLSENHLFVINKKFKNSTYNCLLDREISINKSKISINNPEFSRFV